MKKLLAATILSLIILGHAAAAYASCTTHSYFINGRLVMCTTCCNYGGHCTTNCI